MKLLLSIIPLFLGKHAWVGMFLKQAKSNSDCFCIFFLTLSGQIQIGLTYQMIELDFKLNKSNKTNLPTREDIKSES